jgi:anionic glutamate receptor
LVVAWSLFLLAGQLRYLTLTDPQKVWMPDTFFRNEKTGHFHSILVNNVYVRVFPNGDVLFSIR